MKMFKVLYVSGTEVFMIYTPTVKETKQGIVVEPMKSYIGKEQTILLFFKTAFWAKSKEKIKLIPIKTVYQIYWLSDDRARNEIAQLKKKAGKNHFIIPNFC